MLNIGREYERCLRSLGGTGVLVVLPGSEDLGVIGKDGKGYPVPDLEQVEELFKRNEELVKTKTREGFTRLQLTPIALSVHHLVERVANTVVEHSGSGAVLRTRQDPSDASVPVRPNTGEPVWIWDTVFKALETPEVVYFPGSYDPAEHGGITKAEALRDARLCAFPGWSVGLVEPIPVMPRRGEGEEVGGRMQLEAGSTPTEYLALLGTPPYEGETGWTLEDALTHFIVHMEETGEVSHDRADGNTLWLLGMYMPTSMEHALMVPTVNWASHAGRRMYIGAHRTNNRVKDSVGRSMVRLPAEQGRVSPK